jgi:predicted nucleic acid-binding protein
LGPLVLDASALIDLLLAPRSPKPIVELVASGSPLHVPAICDVEIFAAVRRHVLARSLEDDLAREVIIDYVSLPIARHLHLRLLGRMYELRRNFSAADAGYVALAGSLDASLVTTDAALKRAVKRHTDIACLP